MKTHYLQYSPYQWDERTGTTRRGWRGLPLRAWRTITWFVLYPLHAFQALRDELRWLSEDVQNLDYKVHDFEWDLDSLHYEVREGLAEAREELVFPFQRAPEEAR